MFAKLDQQRLNIVPVKMPGGVLDERQDAHKIDNASFAPDKLGALQPRIRRVCSERTLGHRFDDDVAASLIKAEFVVIDIEATHCLLAARVANAEKTLTPNIDTKPDLFQRPIGRYLERCAFEAMHAVPVRPHLSTLDRSAVKIPAVNGDCAAVSPGSDFIAPPAEPNKLLRDGKERMHAPTLASVIPA
jgi:hypothetical protein